MKNEIGAEGALKNELAGFLRREQIPLEAVDADLAAVTVAAPGGRLESGYETIFAGGWVKCETARYLAEKLGISRREMGKVLNFLDVKIRDCELGCF